MTTRLADAIDEKQTIIAVTGDLVSYEDNPYFVIKVDSEAIRIRGTNNTGDPRHLSVDRGVWGTDRASHASGTLIEKHSVWSGASGGGAHPDLATHNALGLATDTELETHAATPHGGGAHPDLATHEGLGLVTDTDLTSHVGTPHGTQSHAIAGVSHTGTLDHSALGSVSANQHHNQAHSISGADHSGTLNHSVLGTVSADQHHTESHAARHASGQADVVTPAAIGAATSGHNHDVAYEASGTVSTHAGAVDPHTGYLLESAHTEAVHTAYAALATQTELDTHAALTTHHVRQHSTTSTSDHTFPGGTTDFLRADGTFATPTGAPTPDARLTTKVMASTQADITGTTLVALAGLTVAALAAGTYQFQYMVIYQTTATTTGVEFVVDSLATVTRFVSNARFGSTGGAAATGIADQQGVGTAAGLMEVKTARAENTRPGVTIGVDTINADCLMVIEGVITTTTAGDLRLMMAAELASLVCRAMQGSSLVLVKVD